MDLWLGMYTKVKQCFFHPNIPAGASLYISHLFHQSCLYYDVNRAKSVDLEEKQETSSIAVSKNIYIRTHMLSTAANSTSDVSRIDWFHCFHVI